MVRVLESIAWHEFVSQNLARRTYRPAIYVIYIRYTLQGEHLSQGLVYTKNDLSVRIMRLSASIKGATSSVVSYFSFITPCSAFGAATKLTTKIIVTDIAPELTVSRLSCLMSIPWLIVLVWNHFPWMLYVIYIRYICHQAGPGPILY